MEEPDLEETVLAFYGADADATTADGTEATR